MSAPMRHGTAALTIGAIGVVYGDIGTSPLYTVKEIFGQHGGVSLTPDNIIGSISVVIWALMIVVTLKYIVLILRADNHGEGGTLALTALAAKAGRRRPALRRRLLLLGVFGATLFYGDSIITPAISVLGAIEGLELVAPSLDGFVVPIAMLILAALFMVQRHGTAAVGRLFGPIVVVWFITIGLIGLMSIVEHPAILAALNPLRAWHFLTERGWQLFVAVGAIVLALTGAEALYADMGHFGRRPIRIAWTSLVMPSLALNYLGQGALLLGDPAAIENPFYRLFPDIWVVPALILATLAAIIASQAVISGAFSMTKQAIQLGFLPRMRIRYTSAKEAGQIYIPAVNWALLIGVVLAILLFGSSSALAGAYGVAVTLTMLITTMLTYFVVRDGWRLPKPIAIGATLFFFVIDVTLVLGCALKLFDGGWFPLLLGLILFTLMSTWSRGRQKLLSSLREDGIALEPFIATLDPRSIQRASRTAVYPVGDPTTVPLALLHNLKHNEVLHERNIILTVVFHDKPWIPMHKRIDVEGLGSGFWRVIVNLGFMNAVDVPAALELAGAHGLPIPPFETSYFISHERVVPRPGNGLADWRERLFATMARNAGSVAEYFRLPANAVVELGTRVQI